MEKSWYPIPAELAGSLRVPFANFTMNHFYANLMVTAVLLLLGFAIVMVIYSIVYAILGPRKYGPLDSPPIRRKTRPSR
jgi:hypothetical protein